MTRTLAPIDTLQLLRGVAETPPRAYARMVVAHVLAYAPAQVLGAGVIRGSRHFGHPEQTTFESASATWATMAALMLVACFSSGVITLVALAPERSWAEVIKVAARRTPAVFVASCVWFVALVLGSVACVLPGLWVLSMPVWVVLLAEDTGVVASVRRTHALAAGARVPLVVAQLVTWVGYFIAAWLVGALLPVSPTAPFDMAHLPLIGMFALQTLALSVIAPGSQLVPAVFYRLRTTDAGVDAVAVARAFV